MLYLSACKAAQHSFQHCVCTRINFLRHCIAAFSHCYQLRNKTRLRVSTCAMRNGLSLYHAEHRDRDRDRDRARARQTDRQKHTHTHRQRFYTCWGPASPFDYQADITAQQEASHTTLRRIAKQSHMLAGMLTARYDDKLCSALLCCA